MKLYLKLVFIFFITSVASSCSKPNTHGNFLTEHQDAWFDGYQRRGPDLSDDDPEVDKGLIFCKANVDSSGDASPICYQPSFNKPAKK